MGFAESSAWSLGLHAVGDLGNLCRTMCSTLSPAPEASDQKAFLAYIFILP